MKFKGLLLIALLWLMSSNAYATDTVDSAPHFINLAGFYQLQGKKIKLPEIIDGNEAALLKALDGKAHYVFLSNTPDVRNDDVINIQNDILRKNKGGGYHDYGVNCSFTAFSLLNELHEHDGYVQMDEIQLTGTCNMFMVTHDGKQIRDEGFIPPTYIPDSDDSDHQQWKLIFTDKTGIAIYANAESN